MGATGIEEEGEGEALQLMVSPPLESVLIGESSGKTCFTQVNKAHSEFVPKSRVFLAGKNI
jgi:hypothetical protein